jgi:hypothetical protein
MLHKAARYMDRLVKEATEIHFTTNLDKNTGFILSQA